MNNFLHVPGSIASFYGMQPAILPFTRSRFVRFGVRDRVARLLHNPDTCAPRTFECSFFGYRYRGDFSTFIDWSVYYFGAYALGELLLMRDQLSGVDKPIVFDVGANIGHHSLYYASIAEKVHSFEPFPPVADLLLQKIEVNSLKNVVLHRFGLGKDDQEIPFQAPEGCNSGTGKFVGPELESGATQILRVRKGDGVVDELNLDRLDWIKIDVEGFEKEALLGLSKSLERFRPRVFVEWNDEGSTSSDLLSYFPAGYNLHSVSIDPPKWGFFSAGPYELVSVQASKRILPGNFLAIPGH